MTPAEQNPVSDSGNVAAQQAADRCSCWPAPNFAAQRERTFYFTGLLALVALASFILNLAVVGDIFNITSTERALLAWGAFAMVLAYRPSHSGNSATSTDPRPTTTAA